MSCFFNFTEKIYLIIVKCNLISAFFKNPFKLNMTLRNTPVLNTNTGLM